MVGPNGEFATALSEDGSTAVGGTPGGGLHVGLFVRTSGWHLQNLYTGSNFVGTVPAQGWAVALSTNGDTMIESDPDDNNGVGAIWVFAAHQLSTTLTHTGDFHRGQTGATYTMTAKNIGDRAIHANPTETVILVDRLPSGLTATNIQGEGWTCTVATTTCTRADGLAVGASYPPVTAAGTSHLFQSLLSATAPTRDPKMRRQVAARLF